MILCWHTLHMYWYIWKEYREQGHWNGEILIKITYLFTYYVIHLFTISVLKYFVVENTVNIFDIM